MGVRRIGGIVCLAACLRGSARGSADVITDGTAAATIDGGTIGSVAPPAFPATATFENFNEGDSFTPSFTDPLSGIQFFTSSAAGNTNLVIEYANSTSWTAPMFQNNKYLTGNGYSPGNGASLGAQFGFNATLPQLARSVELDIAGDSVSGPYGVSLVIQNSSGVTLGLQTANFGPGFPQQVHVRAESANFDIAKFQIVPGSGGFDGVDNITALAPEPATGATGAVVLMSGFGRSIGRHAGNRRRLAFSRS
jgi:hypothetical protein